MIVTQVDSNKLTVRNAGQVPAAIERPPEPGDYVFTTPTTIRYHWLALWGVIPNLQTFWLLDAVTQGHPIPLAYVGLELPGEEGDWECTPAKLTLAGLTDALKILGGELVE